MTVAGFALSERTVVYFCKRCVDLAEQISELEIAAERDRFFQLFFSLQKLVAHDTAEIKLLEHDRFHCPAVAHIASFTNFLPRIFADQRGFRELIAFIRVHRRKSAAKLP